MTISKDRIKELKDKCQLTAKECEAALKKNKGDVDAALGALIEAGKVKSDQLNYKTVSEELFARAARREKVAFYEQMMGPRGLVNMFGKSMTQAGWPKKIQKQGNAVFSEIIANEYGGKSAEEMAADAEAERIAKVKKLGIKPPSEGATARIMAMVSQRRAALKKNPVTLKLKPFPPLAMGLDDWTGKDVLEAWKGTQERHGGYTSRSSSKPSKGSVMIHIPRIDEDDENPAPPAKEQVAAYAYLKENQVEITKKIMQSLVKYYTKLRKQWLNHNPNLKLPDIKTPEQMRKSVGLGTLHMHEVIKQGVAYIGLEMGCTWDEEHGVGVLLHKNRVVEVGQADTAFDNFSATKDGGKKMKK